MNENILSYKYHMGHVAQERMSKLEFSLVPNQKKCKLIWNQIQNYVSLCFQSF